jgi:hypothetical protein
MVNAGDPTEVLCEQLSAVFDRSCIVSDPWPHSDLLKSKMSTLALEPLTFNRMELSYSPPLQRLLSYGPRDIRDTN